jgi:hypothetical protein
MNPLVMKALILMSLLVAAAMGVLAFCSLSLMALIVVTWIAA